MRVMKYNYSVRQLLSLYLCFSQLSGAVAAGEEDRGNVHRISFSIEARELQNSEFLALIKRVLLTPKLVSFKIVLEVAKYAP